MGQGSRLEVEGTETGALVLPPGECTDMKRSKWVSWDTSEDRGFKLLFRCRGYYLVGRK